MSALPVGRIESIQVGKPRMLRTAEDREWRSAIMKEAAQGPVRLDRENFEGDYQADRKHHGGPDKAVCFFSAEHYPKLSDLTGLALRAGAFGENLTVTGLTEDDVCIGDTLRIGTVLLQVTQPRQPCSNISKRWNTLRLPRLMEELSCTGFYCRVLEPGEVAAGQAAEIVERPNLEWTIRRANATIYGRPVDVTEAKGLTAARFLSDEWQGILRRKLGRDAA